MFYGHILQANSQLVISIVAVIFPNKTYHCDQSDNRLNME